MIEPTQADIGRGVVYLDDHGQPATRQYGVISSFNDAFVFVRFGRHGTTAQACNRTDLEWEMEE